MLSGLRLKHFKRYQNETFDLEPPIILLVGPNSSGKSSILKALLAFKQTYEDQGDHIGFLSRGEYVDVGPYVEYVQNHNQRTKCGFEFLVTPQSSRASSLRRFASSAVIDIWHELDPQTGHGRLSEYTIYPLFDKERSAFFRRHSLPPEKIRYTRMQKSDETYRISISQALYERFTAHIKERPFPTRSARTLPPFSRLNKTLNPAKIQAHRSTEYGMTSFAVPHYDFEVLNLVRLLETLLVQPFHSTFVADLTERTFALAALREIPQRSGPRTDERYRVGSRGQNTASVYLNFRQRASKAGKRRSKIQEDYARLEQWLRDLKLADSVAVGSWRDLLDVRVSVSGAPRKSHSIVDLGVGVSQTLPILVQLAVMPERSRLILEQPELHLYPWAQAEIGRLLCDEAKRGGKMLLIETHSEHVVRGVQRHVSHARPHGADNYFSHDDVAVLYVHSSGDVERLHLDANGEFVDPWPEGFFDQGLEAFGEIFDNKRLPTQQR